jgi:hypothetical protein
MLPGSSYYTHVPSMDEIGSKNFSVSRVFYKLPIAFSNNFIYSYFPIQPRNMSTVFSE